MNLAAIDGELIIVLLIALFGFINWLSGALNKGEKQPPKTSPGPNRGGAQGRGAANPEEERMRRFMEALGLPSDQPPVPRQPIRPPVQARPVVVSAPPPVPERPRRKPQAPVERSLDELETTSLPVEQIRIPELVVSQARGFETVSSQAYTYHEDTAAGSHQTPAGSAVAEALRAALASPQQLRTAFVLREVLGPPVGLRR